MTFWRGLRLGLLASAFLGALIAPSGCSPKKSVTGEQLVDVSDELKPGANPGPKASLILFASEIPVDVERKVEGNDITLRLTAQGEELEVEKYRKEASQFLLVQAASESFEPPLPLLEFPIVKDQKLTWRGKLKLGQIEKPANATTTVTKDSLNEKGFSGEAVKSSIELRFDGGGPKESMRTLIFWFVPSKGIQKRTFDKGSTRVPPIPPEPDLGKTG